MTDLSHGIWAAATASIAYAGHRVAVQWLTGRAQAQTRADYRDERDNSVIAKFEALDKDVRNEVAQMKSHIASLRAR